MCKECFRHSNTATGIYCKPMCRPVQAEICFSSFLVPADVPRTGPLCHLGFPFLFALHRLGFSIRAILKPAAAIFQRKEGNRSADRKNARVYSACTILVHHCRADICLCQIPSSCPDPICNWFLHRLSFEAADQPPHENHPARPQAPLPYFTFWPLRC